MIFFFFFEKTKLQNNNQFIFANIYFQNSGLCFHKYYFLLMAFIADFTFNTYFFPFPQFTNHELTLKYFYCTIEFTRNIGFYRKYDHYVKHFLTKISSSIKLHLCVSKNHHRETKYVMDKAPEDCLITGFHGNRNPFREKSSCSVL